MYAICNPNNIEKVDKAIGEELDKLLKDGVTQTELDEAKKSWLERRKVQRATDAALAMQLDAGLYLGRTFAGTPTWRRRSPALTVNDVNAAMRRPDCRKAGHHLGGRFQEKEVRKPFAPHPRPRSRSGVIEASRPSVSPRAHRTIFPARGGIVMPPNRAAPARVLCALTDQLNNAAMSRSDSRLDIWWKMHPS